MTITFGKKVVKKNFELPTSFKFDCNFNLDDIKSNPVIFIQSGNDIILKNIIQYLFNVNLKCVYYIAADFTSEIKIHDIETFLPNSKILILYVPNYGMDIGKFFFQLQFFKKNNISHIFCALKLHTKSDHSIREKIVTTLIRSNERMWLTNEILRYKDIIGCKELFWTSSNSEYEKTMCENNKKNTKYIMNKFFKIEFDEEVHNSFFEGTMFWFSNQFYQKLMQLDIVEVYKDFSYGRVSNDQLIEHAWERVFCFLYHKTLFPLGLNLIKSHNINLSAIYFPQYHFNEENDTLWGHKFTEWTLLKPNYKKYNLDVPHDDIGFYNLANKHTRQHQSNIAKEFGISSFMIYHYWFKDKAILNMPVELLLNDDEPDIEFFFSWANEPWTKNWDGLEKEILIDQSFDETYNIKKHFNYLNRFFKHKNYKKINNCPVFVIYRADIMKNDINRIMSSFNQMAKTKGFKGVHFILTAGNFDIDFDKIDTKLVKSTFTFFPNYLARVPNEQYKIKNHFDYSKLIEFKQPHSLHKNITNFHSVFTSWNNSVRRLSNIHNATVFDNSSPDLFFKMILNTILETLLYNNAEEHIFIFINAWNEWNEQAMLEPSVKNNYEYIKQIQKLYFV